VADTTERGRHGNSLHQPSHGRAVTRHAVFRPGGRAQAHPTPREVRLLGLNRASGHRWGNHHVPFQTRDGRGRLKGVGLGAGRLPARLPARLRRGTARLLRNLGGAVRQEHGAGYIDTCAI